MTVSTGAVFIPDCMTDAELDSWQAANRRISDVKERALRPCADCPIEFAREMRREGLCNGSPRRTGMTATSVALRVRQWRESQARRRAGAPLLRRSREEVAALALEVVALQNDGHSLAEAGRILGIKERYAWKLREKAAA